MIFSAIKRKVPSLGVYWLLLIPIVLLVTGQISTKFGALMLASGEKGVLGNINIFLIIGYLCLIGRGLVWVFILRKIDLSLAYPFLSISFVIVLFFSHFFFKEEIGFVQVVGTVLIISGITAIGISGSKDN